MRAARENDFQRMGRHWTDGRGGFLMESGIWARVKTANPSSSGLLKNPPRSSFPRPKTNPPYPPLTGGYKKAMRPRREVRS